MRRQLSEAGVKHLTDLIFQELSQLNRPDGPEGIVAKGFGKSGSLESFAECLIQLGDTAATVVFKRFPEHDWVIVLAVQCAPITPIIAEVVEIIALERLRRARKALERDLLARMSRITQPSPVV